MITADYAVTMAGYNAEMNRRLYEAAARLDDAERRADRGAFWGSIHGTLNHLIWADQVWMARFADWPKPPQGIRESATLFEDFAALRRIRVEMDGAIIAWTQTLEDAWLAQDLVWYSFAVERSLRRSRGLLLAHFFNHQTHHRGQVHALLTAAGQDTGDTDLFLLVE